VLARCLVLGAQIAAMDVTGAPAALGDWGDSGVMLQIGRRAESLPLTAHRCQQPRSQHLSRSRQAGKDLPVRMGRVSLGDLPVVLAGFSFGAYVQTRVAEVLAAAGRPAQRMVLVGTAAGHVEGLRQYSTRAVADDTIVIHGAKDETVPLANVLAWAEPFDLPVIVVPGADHFFHRRLHLIRDIVTRAWNH